MLVEIYLLEQLDAFARNGTLMAASEALHLTQPTLTRSMQKLERQIGVPLFERENKKIRLNENGLLAAEYAARILALTDEMGRSIRLQERNRNTLSFGASSPSPIREIAPQLSEFLHGKTVSAEMKPDTELLEGLNDDRYQLISLHYPIEQEGLYCAKMFGERVYYCFSPVAHPVDTEGVHFRDINGRDILMLGEVGFWKKRIKERIPDSRIITLDDNDMVNLLSEYSNLPAFSSDVIIRYNIIRPNRISVPILDDAAYANYYCICKKKNKEVVKIIRRLAEQTERTTS